jgi:pimeloyl-ACP methyl ester carboxylesterase
MSRRSSLRACCWLLAYSSVFAVAAESSPAPAPVTQVWLVNTCSAAGCGDLDAELSKIAYYRLDESGGCSRWQAGDAAAFQASALPGMPTVVLIHGYGTDEQWAVRHGNTIYCLLKQQACGRPFRLVVWSWPADRAGRRRRPDVQSKVCRSDAESYYMARLLSHLPQGVPLSLIGFSLGGRTATGALQLLAGGAVACRGLPPADLAAWNGAGLRPMRVMMVAVAMDCNWLEPGCPHGLTPLAVQRMLVTVNGYDHVLKFYSRLYGPHGPEALGYVGSPTTAGGKIEAIDVSCQIGRKHEFDRYFESAAVFQRLAWYTFLCDAPTAAGKSAEKSLAAANNR